MGAIRTVVSKVFLPEEVWELLERPSGVKHVHLYNFRVNAESRRYSVFRRQSKCAHCNRRVKYALLQKHDGTLTQSAHFNFFSGDGTLMTKDHIKPKSRGGVNNLSNLQTMCTRCNQKKGDKYAG